MYEEQDLTERLRFAHLAYYRAIELAQFKAGFLARISHELRSPLNSMIGTHQLILSDLCDSPAEEREFVGQAHQSALKLMQLIDQVLDVSRLEVGTDSLKLQAVALTDVLDEVYGLTYLQAKNRNLQFQIELPETEIYVWADPKWLKQAITILVDLPLSIMPEGQVTVSTGISESTQSACIWIEDQRPASFWSEPLQGLDLLAEIPAPDAAAAPPTLSPGTRLWLGQTLLEIMQGSLILLAAPLDSAAGLPQALVGPDPVVNTELTRLQCSIPLVALEVE